MRVCSLDKAKQGHPSGQTEKRSKWAHIVKNEAQRYSTFLKKCCFGYISPYLHVNVFKIMYGMAL